MPSGQRVGDRALSRLIYQQRGCFSAITVLNVWRVVVEWPRNGVGLGFIVEIFVLIVLPAAPPRGPERAAKITYFWMTRMLAKVLKTLDVSTAAEWREWLSKHHASESAIWLIFHKVHTGRPSIAYSDALDEAICFGWIDSLIRRIDDDRYALRFMPRKVNSRWSTQNRRRYARLQSEGRLMAMGIKMAPTDRDGDAPKVSVDKLPGYIEKGLKKNAAARKFFQSLAPSHRRKYLIWIESAKQQETKQRRLGQAIAKLAAGHKPTI